MPQHKRVPLEREMVLTFVRDGRGGIGGRGKRVSALIAPTIRVVILVIPHDGELLRVIVTKMRCKAGCKHRWDESRRRKHGRVIRQTRSKLRSFAGRSRRPGADSC